MYCAVVAVTRETSECWIPSRRQWRLVEFYCTARTAGRMFRHDGPTRASAFMQQLNVGPTHSREINGYTYRQNGRRCQPKKSRSVLVYYCISALKRLIYIFIRQKGSSNKWKKHQTHNKNKQTKEKKTTLKSGGLVNIPHLYTNEL